MENVFKVGQKVIHLREGLAEITNEKIMADRPYFCLHVFRGDGENIYVPQTGAENIIRTIMDKNEAFEIMKYMKTVEVEYNSITKQRRDMYKKRLASGSVKDMAFLARQLFLYEKSLNSKEPIKLGAMDIEMLTFASNMLFDELALTFDVDRDRIKSFIDKKMANL